MIALDCYPDDMDEEDMATAKDNRNSLLSYIATQRTVKTENIMVAKTKQLLDDDKKTIENCFEDINNYSSKLKQANAESEVIITEVQQKEQEITRLDIEIIPLQEELKLKDSKDLVTVDVVIVDSDWKWFERQRTEFKFTSEWDIAKVSSWENGWSRW